MVIMSYFLTNGKNVSDCFYANKKLADNDCKEKNKVMKDLDIHGPKWEVWLFDEGCLSKEDLLKFIADKHPAVEKVRWF